MKLYMMKKNAMDTLKREMNTIYYKYYIESTNNWMEEICGEYPFIEIGEVEKFELADLSLPKGEVDAENSKIVYSKLRKIISPSQASDERLWAGLCNGTFYSYLKERWGYNGEIKGEEESNVGNIISRFFFSSGGLRRGIYRNTLSKCWWVGYNLYDTKENHFWRIDALGTNDFSSKVSDIFASNNFSSNIDIMDGILKALLYYKNQGIRIIEREHIRPSTQLLNAIGGAVVLDGLGSDEIADIFIKNIDTIISGKNNTLDYAETNDTVEYDEEELTTLD